MAPSAELAPRPVLRRRRAIRVGDLALGSLTLLAALTGVVLVGLITWEVIGAARPAISEYGLGFLTERTWDPVKSVFGALPFLYGTAVTSLGALLLAAPVSIAIALFLTELAPRWLAGPIGALVEMLASVPSVVIGLWGILVLGPWVRDTFEVWLNDNLGFIPIFAGEPALAGMLPAILVLTMMMIPIISAICRELFLTVPRELKESVLALGTTRWEMIKGVVFPYARAGIAAAMILGLGRAVGEAIAVTQVIGGFTQIPTSLFEPGDTLASRIAAQYQGADTDIHVAAIIYLAVILLIFSLVVNLLAQLIVRRVAARHAGAGG